MSVWAASMLLVAGIAIHAAASHALLGLSARPRDRAALALAFTSAAVALGATSVAALVSSTSPQDHVTLAKWLFFPASVAWTIGVIWFVAFSTGVRPLRVLTGLTLALAATLILNAWLPTGMLHREAGDVQHVELWGSDIVLGSDAAPHFLMPLHDALMFAAFAFVLYALYRAHRAGRSRELGHLALVIPLFALAAIAHVLGDRAVVVGHYINEVGFFLAVLATSLAVQQKSVRDQSALQLYRTRLEGLVQDRVGELDAANAHLARQVEEHRSTEGALRRHMTEIDALQQVSHALTVAPDLSSGLLSAVGHLRDLFAAPHVQVDLVEPSLAEERRLQWNEAIVSSEVPSSSPETESLSLRFRSLLEERRTLLVEDYDFGPADWAAGELGPDRLEEHEAGQLLLVPMLGKDELLGVLGIGRYAGDPAFVAEERRLARTVADHLAVAVENERLHALQRLKAATDERDRLARDLHDAVTQSLYSASLIAEALPAVFARNRDEGMHNLERLRLLVRGGLAEMRTLLHELRPATLESTDLPTLLGRLAEVLTGQAQIPVSVYSDEGLDLSAEIRIVLYRVVQEAFSNIMKHARASHASVAVTGDGSQVVLRVEDDGRGFDPGAVGSDQMGLRIMLERVESVGGRLELTSLPSRGTSIVVVCPLPGPGGLRG